MLVKSLLLLFLLALTKQQDSLVKFDYLTKPDAIKCGNYFYYLMITSTGTSVYSAHTGSADSIETYDATDGVLHNKKAKRYPNNCNGDSFEKLWKSHNAFRLYNIK